MTTTTATTFTDEQRYMCEGFLAQMREADGFLEECDIRDRFNAYLEQIMSEGVRAEDIAAALYA